MTLPRAAELVLNYINANRKARASYPDADLPIEEAMRMLAENALQKPSEPEPIQATLFDGEPV